MNTYKVRFTREDYGYVIIKAESEQEAQTLFDEGEYKKVRIITTSQ
jgi:hypothetical protein